MKLISRYNLLFFILYLSIISDTNIKANFLQLHNLHSKSSCGSSSEKFHCSEISLLNNGCNSCLPKTFFLPRSQGTNTARWLAGWHRFLAPYKWLCEKNDLAIQNGSLNMVVEYTRSFNNNSIAEYLFGRNSLSFSGSQVPNRNETEEILADYLGLPTSFQGSMRFNPLIQNIIVELNYYLALDTWIPGLYTRIHFPLTIALWNLNIKTREKCPKIRPIFPDCYMSNKDTLQSVQTLSSLQQAFSGYGLFGDMNSPFDFGKFAFQPQQKTGIADIYINLGWTRMANQSHYLAFYGQVVIPGGNKPEGIMFFEPMVGNGRRWEVGAGSEGRITLFESNRQTLGIYFLGYVNYRLKAFQIRSFDFKDQGFFSRYMLLKEFNKEHNYAGNMLNAIDYTTKSLRAGSLVVGDASVKLSYYICNFGFDIGYNIWGTTSEKIHLVKNVYPSDLNHRNFAFKGTSGVCYRVLNTQTNEIIGEANLNATSSESTSTSSALIDNPQVIIPPNPDIAITWDSPITNNIILAEKSSPIVRIDIEDLNKCSAALPCQLSHKFFAHIDYTKFAVNWEPEIGVGAEVEFNGRPDLRSTISQWGIWVKGLIAF